MKLFKIIGKKVDFFALLQEQSNLMVDSICALNTYVQTLDPKYADDVKRLEKEADSKRWTLVQELDKTFITPFDREDIFMLSKSLDDILDYYKTTVSEMEIYQIQSSLEVIELVRVLQEGTKNIRDAVYTMKIDAPASMKSSIMAKKCENKVEKLYRKSVAELLKGDDIKYIIKMRELYRHLSNCADRIDQCADLISHIHVKTFSS